MDEISIRRKKENTIHREIYNMLGDAGASSTRHYFHHLAERIATDRKFRAAWREYLELVHYRNGYQTMDNCIFCDSKLE